jgi:predicted RNase H-like HicB family nuclease
MSDNTRKGGASGEHPIMQAVRRKLDSIRDGDLPELEKLNERINRLKDKIDSNPPSLPSGYTIETEQETDGTWIAVVIELPGVMVYGLTREAAIQGVEQLAFQVLTERDKHGDR